MDVFAFFSGLFCLFLIWVVLRLPWVNRKKIKKLTEDLATLKGKLIEHGIDLPLEDEDIMILPSSSVTEKQGAAPESVKGKAYAMYEAMTPEKVEEKPKTDTARKAEDKKAETESVKRPVKTGAKENKDDAPSWENRLGARLPVWLGGIALAFAGIYLVKYSIDNNLITAQMRVTLGGLSGFALVYLAHFFRTKKPNLANGERITQSLTGAGIVVLYASIYAATSLYHILLQSVGFMGMAAVTLGAVLLSLQYGVPIALLGLVGGFATPMLIAAQEPSVTSLFLYLYIVFAALFFVMQRQAWWKSAMLTVGGGFLWVALWLDRGFTTGDGVWLCLFLLALCGTVVAGTWKHYTAYENGRKDAAVLSRRQLKALSYFTGLVSIFFMTHILEREAFATAEWMMFGLVSVAGIVLAWARPSIYQKAPYITFVVTSVLLMGWKTSDTTTFGWTLVCFGGLYIGGSLALLLRTAEKPLWSGLLSLSTVVYFLMARDVYKHVWDNDLGWGLVALALAGSMVYMLAFVQRHLPQIGKKATQEMLAKLQFCYGVTATAFLAFGAVIVLDKEWWVCVIAAEILAIAWLNTRIATPMAGLRKVMYVLLTLFYLVMLPLLLITGGIILLAVFDEPRHFGLSHFLYVGAWPWLHIALPGLALIGAGYFWRKVFAKDVGFLRGLEGSGFLFAFIGLFYILRQAFLGAGFDDVSLISNFMQRGAITAVFLGAGCALMYLGKKWNRQTYVTAGLYAGLFAMSRVVYFELLQHNPYWDDQFVGNLPILNGLWLNFIVPVVGAYFYRDALLKNGIENGTKLLHKIMLVLVLAFVTLQVRHFYHHPSLTEGMTTYAEIYTYSVVWLLTGVCILAWGIVRENEMLRYASLAVIGLAILKVFLYDSSNLEGLYRVFSFFGLGVSLIALSYFYTRFVFQRQEGHAQIK